MKKKFLCVALSAMMVATMCAGCGKQDSQSSSSSTKTSSKSSSSATTEAKKNIKGNITVITNRTDLVNKGGKLLKLGKKFEAKYPGTKVKFESSKDYEKDIAIRLRTKDYGDVLLIPTSVATADLPNFFEELGTTDELGKKYDTKWINQKVGDKVYGLPATANATGLVYNKKVFKEAGIDKLPTSSDEFLEDLQKIKDKTDAIPYYTNYHDNWALGAWEDHGWGSLNGDADYRNNKIPNEKDPFTKGKTEYTLHKLMYDVVNKKLCENDPVTSNWEQSKGMLNNGKIGCMVLGSWAISQMQGAGKHADDVGYMPFPANVDGKQYATAQADYSYAINKNSTNKDTARAWIDFMLDDSGYALSEGSISIKKDDPLPDNLKDFKNVELVVPKAATSENTGKFDKVDKGSEIGLTSNPASQASIIDAAMGKTKKSFDDIMKDWNQKWDKAVDDNK